MAHIGEELGLGAACLFGRVAGPLKFGLVRPLLGDIAGRGNQAEAVPNRDRPARSSTGTYSTASPRLERRTLKATETGSLPAAARTGR